MRHDHAGARRRLAVFIGGKLALVARRAMAHADDVAEPYLPHASVCPFFIGVAALVTATGLALGLWARCRACPPPP